MKEKKRREIREEFTYIKEQGSSLIIDPLNKQIYDAKKDET